MSCCVLEKERCPKCEALLATDFHKVWCLNFGRSCDYREKVTIGKKVSSVQDSSSGVSRDVPVQLSLNLKPSEK